MHIAQCYESLSLSKGGPSHSIPLLSNQLHLLGTQIAVIVEHLPTDPNHLLAPEIPLMDYATLNARSVQSSPPQLLHSNGIWNRFCHQVTRFSQLHNIPLIVSPRGMLEPWALRHKAWKKRIAWLLYQKQDLKRAIAFHATAESEAHHIRQLGFRQPIAVIPNGVESISPSYPTSRLPRSKYRALFLSRLHPKKGLPMLLDAWASIKPPSWELVIAGNDHDGHQKEMEQKVISLGLKDSVIFTGPVYNENKETLYRESDLFILPSHSENFGIVVAEALQFGIPVITTTGTPWQELHTHQCGWWVDPNTIAITAALKKAFSTPMDRLQQMGFNGQTLIRQKYMWPDVAQNMLRFYQWILTQDHKPEFIID
jgi:glycosyltransferase involved in cell wall biosynthesis